MWTGKNCGKKMKVKENDKSPIFRLDSTTLKTFESDKIKGGLVIYFYPKDNTPGCTLETKDFTKLYKKFMGTIRSTIIIKNGKILKIWSNVRVKDHAQEVLDYIKSL